MDSFLNKINKNFEGLEYVRIHSHLLNSLIIEDKNTFFENKNATTTILLPLDYFKDLEINTFFEQK